MLSLLQNVQTDSAAHPAIYSLGTWTYFTFYKVARVWGWALTYIVMPTWKLVALYLHSPICLHGMVLI